MEQSIENRNEDLLEGEGEGAELHHATLEDLGNTCHIAEYAS